MNKITIAIVILVSIIILLIYMSRHLLRQYNNEVISGLAEIDFNENSVITENDIKHLPIAVQKYLRYTGVIGSTKVKSMRMIGEGEFKTEPNKPWVKAKSFQYNFFDNTKRFYYMKLNMSGMPVMGLHSYKDNSAKMLIKLLGIIPVAEAKGDIMNKAETVTVFNDMCIFAPATLIDNRITWNEISPLKVKATFNNNGVEISAELHFNEIGELVNFISNDRYMTSSGKEYVNVPWSTPVKDYKDYNGIKIASFGEAIWKLPDGDYCYGKITIKEIKYNENDL